MLWITISCASPKEVHYVYVKPPTELPNQNVAPLPNSLINAEKPSSRKATAILTSSTVPQTANNKSVMSIREVEAAAAEDVETFRGWGAGSSTNISTARSIAILRAKENLASFAKSSFMGVIDQWTKSLSSATREKVKEHLEGRLIAQFQKVRIVCYYSDYGEVNQYAVCIEVKQEDFTAPIEEILMALTERERQDILTAAKQSEYDSEDNKQTIAKSGATLAGAVIERVLNKCVNQ